MNLLAHAALLIAAVAHPQHHDKPRHHLGPVRVEPNATAYGVGCGGGETTSDGSHVRLGIIASNKLPNGTLLRFRHAVHGRHYFGVHDSGSPGMQLDVWLPSCGEAIRFGRRAVRFQVVR